MNDHTHTDNLASVVDNPAIGHVNIAVDGGSAKITRLTGEKRAAFDQQVFNAVKENGPINSIRLQRVVEVASPTVLRASVASPTVLRASLARLEQDGLIKHTGNKRGTLYEAV